MQRRGPTPAVPRTPPPDFDRQSLPAERLARLVAVWRTLCEDERDSLIAATLVAGDLARLGAPPSILAAAARVIEDEVRHVAVCATVLERLGAAMAEVPAEQRRKAVQSSRVRTMDEHFAELFSSYSALAPRRVPITAIDAAMAPAAASALY